MAPSDTDSLERSREAVEVELFATPPNEGTQAVAQHGVREKRRVQPKDVEHISPQKRAEETPNHGSSAVLEVLVAMLVREMQYSIEQPVRRREGHAIARCPG